MVEEAETTKLCDNCFRVISNKSTHCPYCKCEQDWYKGIKTVEMHE